MGFIIFLLAFAIANISAKKHNNIPSIFGYGFMTVASDSMEGNKEDSFKVGDLIIVRMPNEKRIEKLVVEESIVTFSSFDSANRPILITHRLVDIIDDNGIMKYIAQGDKVELDNPSANYTPGDEDFYLTETVYTDDIVGIYKGKISGAGKVLAFLQTKAGFGLCIVLPTALLLIFEAYLLIKNLFEINRQKLAQELEAKGLNQSANFDPEEEKRRIREELLAEMRKEQEMKAQEEKENKEE